MKPPVETRDDYLLGDQGRVLVSVDVGLGQHGIVTLTLETRELGTSPAPIGLRDIGDVSELDNKLLIVEVLVRDVSRITNKMSVVVMLTGGVAPKAIPADDEVDAEGASLLFRTFVLLRRKQ